MADVKSDIEMVTTTADIEHSPPELVGAQEADEKRLHHNGGTLERYISFISAINFGFILQCSWEATALTFQFALSNGGPAAIVYGSVFAAVGTTTVVLSLAEIASIDPAVGAQYRWSAKYAPKWNEFFGLMQGWITVFAWICTCTSSPAILSNVVAGLAVFNFPDYVPERWHLTLVMWAFTILPFIANFWFRRLLSPLEAIGAVLHVLFFFITIITLAVLAKRSTADYVFNTLTHDVSGWTDPVVAWGIGLLTVTFPISGFDGVLHMSDEVKQAKIRVPRSMVAAVVMNSTMSCAFVICLLFTIGDVEKVAGSPTGLPVIEVFYEATGSKGATNLFIIVFAIVLLIAFFNVFASVSRLVWAFSRDNGLPFSSFFGKLSQVNTRLKMPLNALSLVGICTLLLALINIGSATAFNAFISIVALGLYVSYILPILFFFLRRLSKNKPIYGPFRLGAWGIPLNLFALCYIIFIVIWTPFPTALPVTRDTMNYAGPIMGAIIIGGLIDWVCSGRKRFQVPIPREAGLVDH
ncbi:amino acid transporter [Mytilinidion resinicola]|uniref:Amino acid transporter n=1 Tax=Mytilinidion resinicola TaxID=574789 RepID=A0A6A6Y7D7_9PEZI|nr:amino acid transporter [Mytilinidion resinicola]KAF2804736.1 amino acid transporter [Mytilinidion resinicola]